MLLRAVTVANGKMLLTRYRPGAFESGVRRAFKLEAKAQPPGSAA
jgi:hypothetical protein